MKINNPVKNFNKYNKLNYSNHLNLTDSNIQTNSNIQINNYYDYIDYIEENSSTNENCQDDLEKKLLDENSENEIDYMGRPNFFIELKYIWIYSFGLVFGSIAFGFGLSLIVQSKLNWIEKLLCSIQLNIFTGLMLNKNNLNNLNHSNNFKSSFIYCLIISSQGIQVSWIFAYLNELSILITITFQINMLIILILMWNKLTIINFSPYHIIKLNTNFNYKQLNINQKNILEKIKEIIPNQILNLDIGIIFLLSLYCSLNELGLTNTMIVMVGNFLILILYLQMIKINFDELVDLNNLENLEKIDMILMSLSLLIKFYSIIFSNIFE